MTKIVVVGAGIGGIPAAYELRDLLGGFRNLAQRG